MSEEIQDLLPIPVLDEKELNEILGMNTESTVTDKSDVKSTKPFQNNSVSAAVAKKRKSARVRRNLFMCSPSQLFLSVYGRVAYDNLTYETLQKGSQNLHKASLEVDGNTFVGVGPSKSKAKEIAVQKSLKPKLSTWLASALSSRDKPTESTYSEEDDRPWPMIVSYAVTQLYRSITGSDDAVDESEQTTSPKSEKRKNSEDQACTVAVKKRRSLPLPEDSTGEHSTGNAVSCYDTRQMNTNNAALFRNLLHSKGFVEPATQQDTSYDPELEESYDDVDEDYELDAYNYNYYDYPAYGYYNYGNYMYGTPPVSDGTTSRATVNPLRAESQDMEVPSKQIVHKPAKKIPQDAATRNPLSVFNELMPGTQFDVSQECVNGSQVFYAKTVVNGADYSGRGASKKQAKAAAAVLILKSVFGIESTFAA